MGSIGTTISPPPIMGGTNPTNTREVRGSGGGATSLTDQKNYLDQQNALTFQNGQAFSRTGGRYENSNGGSPMQAHGLSRATNPKRGVSSSPMNYQPLGFTAQEAGYFGPGRYGAAKQYGQDSVTNPNMPQLGNYYPAGGSHQMQFADQANQQRMTIEEARAKVSKGSPAKVPMSAGMYGGSF